MTVFYPNLKFWQFFNKIDTSEYVILRLDLFQMKNMTSNERTSVTKYIYFYVFLQIESDVARVPFFSNVVKFLKFLNKQWQKSQQS